MLIGTDSGCLGKLARIINILARSLRVSPIPTIPPEQTFSPASRTFFKVLRRSSKLRVEIISE